MMDKRNINSKISVWKQSVEVALEEQLSSLELSDNLPIAEAIKYSVLGGGHRSRPILLLAIADIFNVSREYILPVACIAEMTHSASLILDDLPCFDNADVRHGKPSCHKSFGESLTILASHQLISLCSETYLKLRNNIDYDLSCKLENEYTKLLKYIIKGEASDITTRNDTLDGNELAAIYQNKSGRFFSFALVSGALLGEAAQEEIDMLRKCGLDIGLAYQILDDIYDMKGGPSSVGKATGMDEKNQKASTFPKIYGLDKSVEIMEECKSRAINRLQRYGDKFLALTGLIEYIVPK